MKVVALLLVTLCSISSFAGPVQFHSNSVVPQELQSLIARTIEAKCPYISSKVWPVIESRTETFANPPDSMSPNLHFRTVFNVMAEDNDGMHPFTFGMVVESVRENIYKATGSTERVLRIDARDACQYSAE